MEKEERDAQEAKAREKAAARRTAAREAAAAQRKAEAARGEADRIADAKAAMEARYVPSLLCSLVTSIGRTYLVDCVRRIIL